MKEEQLRILLFEFFLCVCVVNCLQRDDDDEIGDSSKNDLACAHFLFCLIQETVFIFAALPRLKSGQVCTLPLLYQPLLGPFHGIIFSN